MKQNFISFLKKYLKFPAILLLIPFFSLLAAFSEPSSAPPTGNADAPINVSGNKQYKTGSLGLGGAFYADNIAVFNSNVGIGTITPTYRLEVIGTEKTDKLQLGNKWLFSGVGDVHANDHWLRLFNKDGTDYFGGIAMNTLWVNQDTYFANNGGIWRSDNKVGIGTNNPQDYIGWAGALDVNGQVKAARYYDDDPSYFGDFNTTSVMNTLDIRGIIRFHNSNTHLYGDTLNLASRPVSGDFYIQNSLGGNGRLCLSGDCRSVWPSGGGSPDCNWSGVQCAGRDGFVGMKCEAGKVTKVRYFGAGQSAACNDINNY